MKKLALFVLPMLALPITLVYAGAPNGFGDDVLQEDLKLQGTDKLQVDSGGDGKLLDIIKGAVNWILGILGLIALIMAMVGGFLMVTASGSEEQYARGTKYLRAAAVGIILIGVAWFIASMIFWLVNVIGADVEGSTADSYS